MTDHPPEERSIVERLARLYGIAETIREYHLADTLTEAHELVHGLAHLIRDIEECREDIVRDCTHCGSPFTYRRNDGDIACKDCPGIMPRLYRCNGCGAEGPRHDLADDPCTCYDDGHELYSATRICPMCGEQGSPHEIKTHNCEVAG